MIRVQREAIPFRLVSWNIERFDASMDITHGVAAVVTELQPDVLAVQEIMGNPVVADRRLRALATACSLECHVEPPWIDSEGDGFAGRTAVAAAETGFNTAILWNGNRCQPAHIPGAWRAFGRADGGFWHALASLVLDIDGFQIRVCSYHANPFAPLAREIEAYRVISAADRDNIPGVVAGDFNAFM